MKPFEQKFFKIGRCIYCDTTAGPLTDEHIIPLALGGKTILKKAVCEPCRVVTSRYESNPIQENWLQMRAALNLPSRHRKLKEMIFPLDVVLADGSKTTLQLKGKETPGLAQFLEYAPPAILTRAPYTSGIVITGVKLIGFGMDAKALKEKHGIKGFTHTTTQRGNDFEKMVAKIAYCLVIAILGPDCFRDRCILPTLMGKRDDIGYWMGCDPAGTYSSPIGVLPGTFATKLDILDPDGMRIVMVRVKFFAASEAPEYLVVVGTLKPGFDPTNP